MKFIPRDELHSRALHARNRFYKRTKLRRRQAARRRKAKSELRDAIQQQMAFVERYGLHPPPHRDRVPILLPEVLSLRDNRSAVLSAINQIRRQVLIHERRVYLYFNHVRVLEPAATLLLVAEIFRCKIVRPGRGGGSVLGNYPSSREVYAQLCDMGFYSLLRVQADQFSPAGILKPDRPLFLPFKTQVSVRPGLAAMFVRLVTRGAFAMAELAQNRMTAALKEAMGNAHEHAYDRPTELPFLPHRWWIAGHLDPRNNEMMILILDLGIGIPNHLKPSLYEQVCAIFDWSATPSDGAMIRAATELYRTSTGQEGRGKGFRDMKRFIDVCDDGELRVLSNRGSYTYRKNELESFADHDTSIGGTLIEWRVRHAAVAEISDD